MNGDPILFYLLVLELPQWKRFLPDLIEIGENFTSLVVNVVQLPYRHGLFSVFLPSSDDLRSGDNTYRLYHTELFRRQFVGDFHQFVGVHNFINNASWDRSFRLGRLPKALDSGLTHPQVRAIGFKLIKIFRLCAPSLTS